MATLRTKRLLLRPGRPEDADAVAAMWSDAETMRYMGGPRDPAKVREAVLAGSAQAWAAVEPGTGEVVADLSLHRKEIDGAAEAELVWIVARPHWGRGLATEAVRALLDHLGRARVVALIDPENTASIRVAEKAGYEFARTLVRPTGKRMLLYVRG